LWIEANNYSTNAKAVLAKANGGLNTMNDELAKIEAAKRPVESCGLETRTRSWHKAKGKSSGKRESMTHGNTPLMNLSPISKFDIEHTAKAGVRYRNFRLWCNQFYRCHSTSPF